MSKEKTIAVAIVLALVLMIGGMLAYFTDTDTRTNVFTLGDDVQISLIENDDWTQENGNSTNMINNNAVGVHPGTKVDKAPQIQNDSTTTPAYVFAEVIVPCYASTGTTVDTPLYNLLDSTGAALTMTTGSAGNTGWTLINNPTINATDKTITYVYAYGTSSEMTELAKSESASNKTKTPAVFSQVQVNDSLTFTQAQTASSTPNIVVNAYGIQTDGLTVTTPTAIFALFGNS